MDTSLKLFSYLAKFLLVLLVTTGFTTQSVLLVLKYTKYETTTSVSIHSYLRETIVPTLAMCVYMELPVMPIRDEFSRLADTFKISNFRWYVSDSDCTFELPDMPYESLDRGQFIQSDRYCHVFKPRDKLSMKRRIYECPDKPLVMYRFKVTFKKSDNTIYMTNSTTRVMFLMAPFGGDFESQQRMPDLYVIHFDKERKTFDPSYAVSVTRLLPLPYETNCRDYQSMAMTSRENCLVKCFNAETKKRGYLLDKLLYRDEYGNSPELWMPYMFKDNKTLHELRERINSDFRKPFNLDTDHLLNLTLHAHAVDALCENICSKPSCHMEMIKPIKVYTNERGHHDDYSETYHFDIYILPPAIDPAIVIESKPQMLFAEFFTLLTSCVSFWFGLCPLSVAMAVSVKIGRITRRQRRRRRMTHIQTSP